MELLSESRVQNECRVMKIVLYAFFQQSSIVGVMSNSYHHMWDESSCLLNPWWGCFDAILLSISQAGKAIFLYLIAFCASEIPFQSLACKISPRMLWDVWRNLVFPLLSRYKQPSAFTSWTTSSLFRFKRITHTLQSKIFWNNTTILPVDFNKLFKEKNLIVIENGTWA